MPINLNIEIEIPIQIFSNIEGYEFFLLCYLFANTKPYFFILRK